MQDELLRSLEKTFSDLRQLLSAFNEDELNTVPFEGSWTAAQLARHLIMSSGGFAQVLNGPVKTTDRAPDKFVAQIKRDFLTLSTKMQSPEMIRPAMKRYDKERLLESLDTISATIANVIQKADLSQTCMAFEMPGLGFLTRLEAISFVLFHTQRHIHQLEGISKSIIGKEHGVKSEK